MVAVLVVLAAAFGLYAWLDLTRPFPTQDAAPAPETPAAGPARALPFRDVRRCATDGHVADLEQVEAGRRPVCTKCGVLIERRTPYDRVAVEVDDLERLWAAS